MNLLFKSLILAVIGCSMTQVSAMHKRTTGQKPGQSGNIGSFLKAKYCAQPVVVAQGKPEEKPEKKAEKPVNKPAEKNVEAR